MLTRTELTAARLFLQHAHASVLWVSTLFLADGNSGAAARLNDVAARLVDEMADIDALMEGSPAVKNSQYLHDLVRSHPQLHAAQDMLDAGKWDEEERDYVRFDLPRLRKLYDFQFHWEQMSFAIEQRFEQTIGLIRALEAVSSEDAAVRAIAAKARRDYRLLIELFQEFASRNEPDDGDGDGDER